MTKKTQFGTDLIGAIANAAAHAEGEHVAGIRIRTVDLETVDAKAVRRRLHLTQDEMATMLATSSSGYKKWEQGQR